MKTDVERFEEKYSVDESGCWIWSAATFSGDGYGCFYYEKRNQRAHRASYEMFVGQIPEGMVIDHVCMVKLCVNPDHLEPVTIKENYHRYLEKQHNWNRCRKGHEYDYFSNGQSYCKTCRREYLAKWRANKKLIDTPILPVVN